MRSDDLTGFWTGRYDYDDGLEESVQFVCNFRDEGGSLSGEVSECVSVISPGEQLSSFVRGKRSGRDVFFSKTYDGAGSFAHRVDYAGQLSEDGTTISGYWDIEGEGGSFVMGRPAAVSEGIAVSRTVEENILD